MKISWKLLRKRKFGYARQQSKFLDKMGMQVSSSSFWIHWVHKTILEVGCLLPHFCLRWSNVNEKLVKDIEVSDICQVPPYWGDLLSSWRSLEPVSLLPFP